MITALDLRIQYRRDTGEDPTYGVRTYKGPLKWRYVEWLETGTERAFREMFWKNRGMHATFKGRRRQDVYNLEYKKWIEETRLILERIKLNYLKD